MGSKMPFCHRGERGGEMEIGDMLRREEEEESTLTNERLNSSLLRLKI
jgi:hypothetical protein